MSEKDKHDLPIAVDRRGFVGGITSMMAAAAFSVSVPERVAAQVTDGDDASRQTVTSPDGTVEATVDVADGAPTYSVAYDGTTVIDDSGLGFEFQGQADFDDDITVTGSERSTVDETWSPVWDQYDEIREHYEELRLGLAEEADGRALTLELRVFDDGVGFRYVFPEAGGFGDFVVASERTEFAFGDDYTSWWIPNDFNSYEYTYNETPLSEIGGQSDFGGAHTPITMRTDDGLYLSVHEADLVDYGAMAVEPARDGAATFESSLAPLPDGSKVSASAPHRTPWRTIQLGERPGDLIESNLIVNLNEDYDPDEFPQGVDWIEPQKFIGVWWLMITGRADWEFTGMQSGNHGAQTGRVKQYMDFASEHDIPSVLVEGWNQGWSSYPDGGGDAFDYTEPYPDFDLREVTDYGPSLDPPTQMTMHNETAGGFQNYESQIDDAFDLYDDLGIRSIKNGYVNDDGNLGGEGHNHHNQVLVNHHHLVARTAAANRQMLDVHEPVHPTGRRRTYPNLMTSEGVYGQEYDSFGHVPPAHHVTFPFTRMLGGPVEYTPGIFDMDSGSGGIETTRAKQLAMYPTYFSGLQMAADLPSSYLADQPATLGVGDVAQAEWAALEGVATAASWANAQGEQYVEFDPNSVDAGSTVSWTLEGVNAGEYDLHLRYASDGEDNAVPADEPRTATVTVDGAPAATVTFPPTDYWDVWDAVSTAVTVDEDAETVGVALTEGDTGGFNLDSVALTDAGDPMPEPETAPIRGPTVDEFQFIEDVPAAGWDDTRVLESAIGEYMVTARKKDDEWYVGAMTDENGRAIDVLLDFLDEAPGERKGHKKGNGKGPSKGNGRHEHNGNGRGRGHTKGKYVAEIYSDGIEASFDDTLKPVRIDRAIVDADTTLLASMVESGGTAVRLYPASWEEVSELPVYERPTQELSVDIADEAFVREPFVEATGSNRSDYIGGRTVELVVDGETVRTVNARFPPNSSDETYEFSYSIDRSGTYDVEVETSDGETMAAKTVTVTPPETIATLEDPEGDDHGPGTYTYPTADAYRPGAFDLRSVSAAQTPSLVQFELEVENLYDVWGGRFSPHLFSLWVRDPSASGGATESLDDLGANVSFERPWHYRLHAGGWSMAAVDAGGSTLTDDDGSTIAPETTVDFEADTVTLTIDRDAFGGTDPADLEIVAGVGSAEYSAFRPVEETASGHRFGGAKAGAVENAPLLIDVTTPTDVSQETALEYTAEELATVPFTSLDQG
ncbi:glycoside hydrolase family 97 catalytic domain-containing protein [Halostagnicola kamekurae]|uniref:Glycosyl-hydrolase 97 C-terminal, oligomerisation n=1 Tax=Halostagnicola kamekurae TaxID=619731 RepID=A0A1I6U928_9EURY|nr:glycoside hydrolase family 97 catalytic domain-containing protein [Halostagnicola kamekurae]SFS97953.1 Glycosyl-hydrolase 97 C-terminal, oligomerisation [Halostagnicola kamekurae]